MTLKYLALNQRFPINQHRTRTKKYFLGVCGQESFCQTTVDESLGSSFPLCAIRSIWLAFRCVSTALLPCPTPTSSWRLVVQHVESLCVHVCVLRPLTALYPRLRNSLDAIVGSSDGPCHAGYGVCVPSQGQAVRYCPLQAAVVLWKALPGLQAVEDTEDGCGDWVECCNAVTWKGKQGMMRDKKSKK